MAETTTPLLQAPGAGRAPRRSVPGASPSPAVGSRPSAARAIGILILAAYLFYGVGSAIATSMAAGVDSDSNPVFLASALSMLVNSALVIGIGILMFPLAAQRSRRVAGVYLATRLFEGTSLAAGVVALVVLSGTAAVAANSLAYNIGMAGLGIGSLFLMALLYRTRLVPRFLAAWGFVGYAVFAAGSVLEVLGVTGAGLIAAAPGGLFEVAFGIWLIVRGFGPSRRELSAG